MTKKVLIVDDEPAIRDLLVAVLEDEGYLVVTAESGAVALDLVRKERPDLVLLDIMLPGMDGREVCRRLREQPEGSDLPIVLMSAALRPDLNECGATAFLPKPFDLDGLLDTLNRIVGQESSRSSPANSTRG